MQTRKEIRRKLESIALDMLYIEASGSRSFKVDGKTEKRHVTTPLSTVLENGRDLTARQIIKRAKAGKEQSQHARDKAAKAARIAVYSQAALAETEIPYDVDEDRLYRAEMAFVSVMVEVGHVEASELKVECDEADD